jgi:hypothetical protein
MNRGFITGWLDQFSGGVSGAQELHFDQFGCDRLSIS